ncbi:hypothetical protein DFQ01_106182 [Paenibacillus cellulosilyticus]|uniref:Uncharacterized protein n=1 Tax=Paenibacillus cellulosilyticus TaxID=375489 RepID=A0A2V2YV97_9BACL|nr:hypothetical protein [Paenibacillus cellulosilyticus]PWW04897.1 hypothetical protein DFQ01_106182 [Paenibacillus cellulosilyticus]QKS46002.1 hypothetical protein HUB94_17285 [Paenibacillus cellulosilyticus]
MINVDTLYIHVRHWLFWYGVYGFTNKSCNDEITLFSDKEQNNRLAYFDLLTLPCLIDHLNSELDETDGSSDNAYMEKIQSFIDGDKEIGYSYIYPRDEEDESYQVNHSAPLNEKGLKPTYIYVWSKQVDAWDRESISDHVTILAREFLQRDVENIVFLDIPSYEETKASYEEDYARFGPID